MTFSIDDLSDEEVASKPDSFWEELEAAEEAASDVPDEDVSEEEAQEEVGDEQDSNLEEETEETNTEEESDEESDNESEEEQESSDDKETEEASDESTEESESEATTEEDKESGDEGNSPEPSDAEAQLARLFAPFKANGSDMQVDNIDDAITLMQQGANYSKKMQGIKPAMRLSTMLTNNGIDENNLGFLIDLKNGDKGAIAKLIADSGIDPLEIDTKKDPGYKPNSHSVDDAEVKLNDTLAGIRETPTYSKTVDIVSKQWDDESKTFAYNNPQLIADINEHISNGSYDIVMDRVNKERMFGRLSGLSDHQAYINTFRQIASEQSNVEVKGKQSSQSKLQAKPLTKSKPKLDAKTKTTVSKKKKLSGDKRTKTTTNDTADFNPFAMSDEEFLAATKSTQ